jgi:hypothetical protein
VTSSLDERLRLPSTLDPALPLAANQQRTTAIQTGREIRTRVQSFDLENSVRIAHDEGIVRSNNGTNATRKLNQGRIDPDGALISESRVR